MKLNLTAGSPVTLWDSGQFSRTWLVPTLCLLGWVSVHLYSWGY